ncbi:DivIVA domain-containing protein [Curtobacterium flaccumfaciens pv. flaccumfaciens]|jgi:DivIVA domain-containing protein|nr:DivIVA domain-containing protein [Curtobacterium flaccumfaciens]PZE27752.1 DivIVA domain-containing protein [Curtobacterium sp. MCLR17_042]PZE87783.1 DivIVA domain-containing protein [Curtobacterium sp. MCLR17_039]QKS89373.1 DivIVA domain-containing protein [Curtobacterium flaccumfaciens pv. flaccumfaciens]NUU09602.1 DivIVA domain-containing protein [Curtobacterium flaccumfaciens]
MLAREVADKRFRPTKFREGYDQSEVDAFLDRIQTTLAGYEQRRPVDPLTPEQVAAVRFQPTKFREGYDQGQVDDFLDEVVVALRQHGAR